MNRWNMRSVIMSFGRGVLIDWIVLLITGKTLCRRTLYVPSARYWVQYHDHRWNVCISNQVGRSRQSLGTNLEICSRFSMNIWTNRGSTGSSYDAPSLERHNTGSRPPRVEDRENHPRHSLSIDLTCRTHPNLNPDGQPCVLLSSRCPHVRFSYVIWEIQCMLSNTYFLNREANNRFLEVKNVMPSLAPL